jgi:UDP-N-acetylglucosamine transferase subunit ALG13
MTRVSNLTQSQSQKGRVCFVTVGATASFDALIKAVLGEPFVGTLVEQGYNNLIIQYGAGGKELFDSLCSVDHMAHVQHGGFDVVGFDFDVEGLDKYMAAAKGFDEKFEGVIVSHAGMATIQTLTKSMADSCFRNRNNSRCFHAQCSPHPSAKREIEGQPSSPTRMPARA